MYFYIEEYWRIYELISMVKTKKAQQGNIFALVSILTPKIVLKYKYGFPGGSEGGDNRGTYTIKNNVDY